MPKSCISLYWKTWLGLVLCLLIVRFTFLLRVEGEDAPFALFNCYAIPTWIAVMILNMVESRRLMNYLRQNHRKKWAYITSGPGFGPGGFNSFRSLPFVYSDDDLGDVVVNELKKNYRRFVKLALTVFFTLPLLFIITMLPWWKIPGAAY